MIRLNFIKFEEIVKTHADLKVLIGIAFTRSDEAISPTNLSRNIGVSYKRVYDILNKFVDKGILTKSNGKYYINTSNDMVYDLLASAMQFFIVVSNL